MKIILPYIMPHERKDDRQAVQAQQQMIERLQRLRERSSAAYDQLHSELQDPDKHREKPMTGWADLELEKITGYAQPVRPTDRHANWSIHLFTSSSHEGQRQPRTLIHHTAALL